MTETHIHKGPYNDIPTNASPGLIFLKKLLPALDSLGPFDGELDMTRYLAPDATFAMNGGPAMPANGILQMLPKRSAQLSKFHHDVHMAWDMPAADGSGRRTVMYESTSISSFKLDPENVEVKVGEFNIVELVPVADAATGATELKASQLRAFLDGAPVTARAQMIAKD